MFVYAMLLGDLGQIKVGYTNDLQRRAGEHGRRFNCRKQVKILSAFEFTSKATVEMLENQLIVTLLRHGFKMVIDPQNGLTERFYLHETIKEVELTARKKTYKMIVG